MVAVHKSTGAIATTPGESLLVPIGAVVAGDYAVMDVYVGASATPPTISGWTLRYTAPDAGTGARHVYWRAFTGTAAATNVTVPVAAGGAYGKIVVVSGAGTGEPTVLPNQLGAIGHWQSAALTEAYARLVIHFAFIFAVRPQGTLSNQGTITSTNTSRNYDTPLSAYQLQTVSSALTSSAGGSVRGSFSSGNADSWTVSIIIPEPAPATPTGLAVTGAERALEIDFDSVAGADSYAVEWRRASLPGTFDGDGVNVVVFDAGVRLTHTQFTGRVATGYAIPGQGTGGSDQNGPTTTGHGTEVASAAVGSTLGTAPGATLVPVRIGSGFETDVASINWDAIDDAADWVIANVARPAVLQFAGFWPKVGQPYYDTVTAIFQKLIDAGIPVVISIGNSGGDIGVGGAKWDDMIVVGGTTAAGAWWTSSDYGLAMDVLAQGYLVPVAYFTSDSATGTDSGTSFASPQVSGVIAKVLEGNPELSPARVFEVIQSQASPTVTGVPVGVNLLLNEASNTDGWSRHTVASNSLTLDGLDPDAEYEIRVATIDNGTLSAWSSTDSATTTAGGFARWRGKSGRVFTPWLKTSEGLVALV